MIHPHLLPDFLAPSEWRSWRHQFQRSIIKAFKDYFQQKVIGSKFSDYFDFDLLLFHFLDKPSYTSKRKQNFLYIVKVEGNFDWDYLVSEDSPLPSEPWRKWKAAITKRQLSFYKYGLTKYPDILKRDILNYKSVIDSAEVSLNAASWSEHALSRRLRLRYPKSVRSVYFGNKREGTWESLNKSFVGFSESFHFDKNPDLLKGLCTSTVKRISKIYNIGGDEALTAYSHAVSWLGSCISYIIHEKMLRISSEYIKICFYNSGKTMPLDMNNQLRWALENCAHEKFHDLCYPFMLERCKQYNLERLYSDDFLKSLTEIAR